jgi:amino acid adenylation domain-containing protein
VFLQFDKTEIEQSICDRFEAQARLYPNRVAIAAAGKAISYSELNRVSNQISSAILRLCNEDQARIALLLESGELMIAAILGVLKTGNTYVPLDPSSPKSRNRFILGHAEAKVLLTNGRNLSLAEDLAGHELQLLNVEHLASDLPTDNLAIRIPPDAIAYIIYTSGSTGQPKGVIETHRNLLHNVMRNTNTLRISSEDRISLLRSIGAGGATRDALSALLNGAALYPFSVKEEGLNALAAWLRRQEISIFTTVITVFRHLAAILPRDERFPSVRIIYAGGEQVTRRDVELYKKHFSDDCLFVNRLGITETGTVTYFFIDKRTHLPEAVVPVGYPADDTEILILDENGNELGPNCTGEIAIRSEYMSPGYWKSPENSQSVFISDHSEPNKRVYRTGDFGRKLPDGCVVHLGWKDFQVNIRGYRIELAEVEAELLNHPDVLQAAVVGREHWSGEIRLVGVIVPAQKNAVSAESLRFFLEDRLPDHMIPSAFMMLDALPLNANGKIDRRALHEPDWLPATDSVKGVHPRTELEDVIAGIWEATLGIDGIGIEDNFFRLGGHSLLVGQVLSKIKAAFQIDVPLASFLEEPTVAFLARAVQRALQEEQGYSAPITVLPRPGRLPLSFAQERIWFLHQLEPANFSYNFPTATLIEGKLNIDAVRRALDQIVERHEALRSTFVARDDGVFQVVVPDARMQLPLIDLSHLAESESQAALLRTVRQLVHQTFDLSNAPLLRVALLKLDDSRHVLLTVHHMVADGWSIGILFNELSILYEQYCAGREPRLPELMFQYADFAAWQRQSLHGKALEAEIAHWKEELGDVLPAAELASDRARAARQSFLGGRTTIVLPKDTALALKRLARRESATMFMVLLAALKTLLFRYTGTESVIVGSPVAGRNRAELENLIGLFTNTLVLKTELSDNPSFLELVERVRKTCLKAYAHQDLPFEKLVEQLQPQRDLSRNPLFQTMFIMQNTPNSVLKLAGLRTHRMDVESGTSKFDLTLSIAEENEQLVGSFEYSSDLFEHSTIARMADHYKILLQGIIDDPGRRLSELPLLSQSEHRRLIGEWNDTVAEYPNNRCLHTLFEEQAARSPGAIGLTMDGRGVPYRELNRRANQLASYLIGFGIGPGERVGICLERSLEIVVALLAVLKTGATYVPLDPSYPQERLTFMLDDARVSALVKHDRVIGGRQLFAGARRPLLVCLDGDRQAIEQQSSANPSSNIPFGDSAYIIYTSGSTGTPKGVEISHRSIVNCLQSVGQRIGFDSRDVMLAVTTISFDIAVLELFLPLLVGGKVALASREEATDGRALARRLAESTATALQATPLAWRLLLNAGWHGAPGFKILCGGEPMASQLAKELLAHGKVWNLYGPTETTIWSTVHEVESGEDPVPIGRPIANTQIYILDGDLNTVPIAAPGELYIGGDGLARGYLNDPQLTAERFVPHPFAAGQRLYRTGDCARYVRSGNIEFLGRIDDQVKLRGYRIELGEIEATLARHPAVREAIVVARGAFPDETDKTEPKSEDPQWLVAYIVPAGGAVSPSELRNFLRSKLPDYMIPSFFLSVEAVPRMPNGKIDRNALPAPNRERAEADQRLLEPRNELEELVAQVWREVLKIERLGIHENFFELGGHSLLATRVTARLRAVFDIDLPLRKVFELPTVGGLAKHIEAQRHAALGDSLPPIVPAPRDRPLPLSFSQRRLWFLMKLDPGITAYNIPASFKITGNLDVAVLEASLKQIINRHEILRTRIAEIDGQPFQEIISEVFFKLTVLDLSAFPPGEALAKAERLAAEDARERYDLSQAPLMRAKLLRLGERDHVLILNFHHIICDGSSLVIFYRELADLYGSILRNEACRLPPLPIQYADYSVWQNELLRGGRLERQRAYWKRRLGTDVPPVNLPADHNRPAVQSYRGARASVRLSEDLTRAIKRLSLKEGVTLFMTLLAAFSVLLLRLTGRDSVVVGSSISGRGRQETEGLIGFFINAIALHSDLSGDPTFLEFLKRVREVCLEAYAHHDLPFEKVVEEANPRRDFGRNPIFDVLFNLIDKSERVFSLPECEVTKITEVEPAAKFDMVFDAPEVDGKLEVAIVYNADLFTARRIQVLLQQFEYLLLQVTREPNKEIDRFSLVPPAVRPILPNPSKSLGDTWEGAIHELVSERARITPQRLAVIGAEAAWTYEELERQSAQLANWLVANGIQPKDSIAVYAHRNASLVLTLLGIFKAGAAFVILDPAYPPQRLVSYLRIARPKGWIQMAAAGELPEELTICLDTLNLSCRLNLPNDKRALTGFLDRHPDAQTGIVTRADDPAYIAFTSGSTGEPKGVLSRHGPITHFLPWQKQAFDLHETDRFCLLSGLAYNHLHRDIFTALYLGATLYVPPPEIVREPEQLLDWLRRNAISVLHLTPALGELLLTAAAGPLPSVRRVFFGGDILTAGEVAEFCTIVPNARIGSFYGATETQRAVGYYEITNDFVLNECDANRPVPLGCGIKDVQLLLLNKNGHLAGVGELAQLYVRSPHLAHGYIADDELTAEKFLINPFTNDPADRVYRTGEVGRYLPDGNVEWVGRTDRQVNIRGFRVELEEVEFVLKQHPAVKDAAVVMQHFEVPSPSDSTPDTRDSSPGTRLMAYVAADEDQRSFADLLHGYLSTRLPEYMVPADFVILEQLPLSPNGKIDYGALPDIARLESSSSTSVSAPLTEVERKLAAIFCQLLGREQVGTGENFFRSGGHSLLAAQAAARIREAFEIGLDLRTFLESPTVASLAKAIEVRLEPASTTSRTNAADREEIEL